MEELFNATRNAQWAPSMGELLAPELSLTPSASPDPQPQVAPSQALFSADQADQGHERLVEPVPASVSRPKRGRPPKGSSELWSTEATEALFKARYIKAKDSFDSARNHVDVGAAWIRVATLVSISSNKTYEMKQCKDKMKWLRRKWADYRQDRVATGNIPKQADPPCLELMLEHWAPNEGLQNTTLCDNGSLHDLDFSEGDETTEPDTDNSSTRGNKRKKANGEYVEAGLCALAEGVKNIEEAMKARSSASDDTVITRDVIAALHRKEAALSQQPAAIHELIRTIANRS